MLYSCQLLVFVAYSAWGRASRSINSGYFGLVNGRHVTYTYYCSIVRCRRVLSIRVLDVGVGSLYSTRAFIVTVFVSNGTITRRLSVDGAVDSTNRLTCSLAGAYMSTLILLLNTYQGAGRRRVDGLLTGLLLRVINYRLDRLLMDVVPKIFRYPSRVSHYRYVLTGILSASKRVLRRIGRLLTWLFFRAFIGCFYRDFGFFVSLVSSDLFDLSGKCFLPAGNNNTVGRVNDSGCTPP